MSQPQTLYVATGTLGVQGILYTIDAINGNVLTTVGPLHDVAGGNYSMAGLGNHIVTLLSPRWGLLVGDTNGDASVNAGDIGQTLSQSGQAVTSSNFREDLTVDGTINAGDIGLVKSKSGTALP